MKNLRIILVVLLIGSLFTTTQAQQCLVWGSAEDSLTRIKIADQFIGKKKQKLIIRGLVQIDHSDEDSTQTPKDILLKFHEVVFEPNAKIITYSNLTLTPVRKIEGYVDIESIRGRAGLDGTGEEAKAQNGSNGNNGGNGGHGRNASCGCCRGFPPLPWSHGAHGGGGGGHGGTGQRGANGDHGSPGSRGFDASNITLDLYRKVKLKKLDGIRLSVVGGDGGNGGNGQEGGNGGRGGHGGRGGDGGDGSECGRSPKNGGRGGNGGQGGPAGNGGNGGDGGDGGNGGLIKINYSEESVQRMLQDDSFLTLLYSGGKGGVGGLGADAGIPGSSGIPGLGGLRGRREGIGQIINRNGQNGDAGNQGGSGAQGANGEDGQNGSDGADGTVIRPDYLNIGERQGSDFFDLPEDVSIGTYSIQ